MYPGLNRITEAIIVAAIKTHRNLGPGLLESAYEAILFIVEIKAVDEINPIHRAQLISYLRLSGCPVNFHRFL